MRGMAPLRFAADHDDWSSASPQMEVFCTVGKLALTRISAFGKKR